MKNYQIQGFAADMIDEGHSDMTAFVQIINRKIADALLVDAAFLTAEASSSSAMEHTLIFNQFKGAIDAYADRFTPMKMFMETTVEGYVLVYLQKRAAIILCGTGIFGYTEHKPRRFSSARRARIWARNQIGVRRVDPRIEFTNIDLDESTPLKFETGFHPLLVAQGIKFSHLN